MATSLVGAFLSPIPFPSASTRLPLSKCAAVRRLSSPSAALLHRSPRKWSISAAAEALEQPPPPPPAAAEPEPVEAQIAASEASEVPKGEDVFAVVMIGSRQYIVFPGRYLTTQRLKGANADDKIILSKVLLVGTRTKTYVGQPVVTNAAVHAVVEEQGLNRKVIVYKYKRKKNYRRNIGHRQPNTRIRITGISGYQDFPAETLESLPA